MRAMVLPAQAPISERPLERRRVPIPEPGRGEVLIIVTACAEFTGYHADGGYAEYAVVPQAYVYPLPPVFGDAEAAPLLCAGIIGYRALKLAAVTPGGTLGLYGFGSSAHITLQIAVARDSTVYVCTREPAHRELARAPGAAWVGEPNDRMPAPAAGIGIVAPAGG